MRVEKMHSIKSGTSPKTNTNTYMKKIKLIGVQNSNAIALPAQPISSISIQQTGNANIYLTNYSYDNIKNNIAKWILYDGVSEINTAITAVYIKNTTGKTTVNITVTRIY